MSLAVKYRPKKFKDVYSQDVIITILEKQLQLNKFPNSYLFTGVSGTGKTTLATILANEINKGQGNSIEIDGASNNGVDNVRKIIEDAKERSLDSEYKIYIIDECHSISNQGWQAFLKCLEEPPKYTIFIFCTTDPQKIPKTILNRVMRFNLVRIKREYIEERLKYICKQEDFNCEEQAIKYISKLANGDMRKAISYLEKCSGYSIDITLENALNILGDFSYGFYFKLTNNIIDRKEDELINSIEELYNKGVDLKYFVDSYLNFILDLTKYCIFQDTSLLLIPDSFTDSLNYTTSNGHIEAGKYFKSLLDVLLDLKNIIKWDSEVKNIVIVKLLQFIRS